MQNAKGILQAMQKLGADQQPLTRIYRCLYSEELFLIAYDKISRKKGSLTPGSAGDTADGMNMEIIRKLIDDLRHERFHFRPARRQKVPKKQGGHRPLGIPDFPEKLVQEVMRMILDAYYEPHFRNSSHGFRPQRGCHTALGYVESKFQGAVWFIEGDIRGCFDNIDHGVLINILSKDIQDKRFINLIQRCLDAGYLEDWVYHRNHSGTPQGSVISPLLANIYLHELDQFIEDVLIPQYTKGKRRAPNNAYRRLNHRLKRARENGAPEKAIAQLEQQCRQMHSKDSHDPNFRRLQYCRYADDFILGFIGSKAEAMAIKEALTVFLREKLHLELNSSKTLITHARSDYARFLNYAISIYHVNDKITRKTGSTIKQRSINGKIRLGIPHGVIDEKCKRYLKKGKPIHEPLLLNNTDAHIIDTYQQRFRGIAEYYKHAIDRHQLGKLKQVMEISLTKTLARKFKMSVRKIYRKYNAKRTVNGYTYKTLEVNVPTSKGTRTIFWGAIPLRVKKPGKELLQDEIRFDHITRSDLVQRLQANRCELCGSEQQCEVHHIKKLSNLKKRWQGRKAKPDWVERMIALRRKTLVVCRDCHLKIHSGKAVPSNSNEFWRAG